MQRPPLPRTALPRLPLPRTALPRLPVQRTALPRLPVQRTALPRLPVQRTALPRLLRPALRALSVGLLLAGSLAGCGSSAASEAPPVSAGTPVPSVQADFNPTDLAWIQLMVPMDEQLLQVLDLAGKQSTDPAVRKLASQLTVTHRAELAQLVALRTRSGSPTTNVHEGHDMPGMMTEPELVAMGKAQGAAFDQLFRKNLKEHLDQSIIVARSIRTAGHEPSVKKLAATIETGRAAQLKLLAAQ